MSVFTVPIEVRNGGDTDFQTLDGWVDTGSFYSALPQPFLESLGVLPHRREQFMLADGTITARDLGRVWVRIGDRSASCRCHGSCARRSSATPPSAPSAHPSERQMRPRARRSARRAAS